MTIRTSQTGELRQGDIRFKIAALRAHPTVAVTIATHHQGAKALLLRGEVTMTEADGLLEEYALAHRRTMGEEASRGYLAAIVREALA
ncbi:MAG TPA: hypothetical protein VF070_00465 [Streptosporangiaceae bacterium]